MKVPFVRSPYNYDVMEASDASGLDCSRDKGRTQQSFAEDADINVIVKRFGLTGELPENVPQVLEGDFSYVTDFQGAMDLIVRARESFDAMPAAVRSRFDNDAGKFVAFTSDEANFAEAATFGLVRPEAVTRRAEEAAAKRKAELEAAAAALVAERARAASSGQGTGST